MLIAFGSARTLQERIQGSFRNWNPKLQDSSLLIVHASVRTPALQVHPADAQTRLPGRP